MKNSLLPASANTLLLDPEFTWGSAADVRNKAREFIKDRLEPPNKPKGRKPPLSMAVKKMPASRRMAIPKITEETSDAVKKTISRLQEPRNILHRKVHFVSKGLTDYEASLIGKALHGNIILQELNLNGNQICSEGTV
jgi:hypothetical protein